MKLLYITNGIKGAGGLERVLAIKASYLADVLGYEVHILTLNHNNAPIFYDFSPKIQLHDVAVYGNPIQYLKKYVSGIKNTVQKIQPDVLSVCDDGLKGFFMPQLLSGNYPIIYERHVSKIIELGDNPSFVKKKIVGLKFFVMNQLAKSFDKFVVLTDPIESASLQRKTVIAVGKQSFQKGFDRLLQSWVVVQKKYPDWSLEIYGKSSEKEGLVAMSKELNLNNSVLFFEPVKNIQQKYTNSAIFAFSSRFEGFGMVLIEAMACGVPCVSYDCPCGPSDIINSGDDGFLVENGNINQFAQRLIQLIEDESLRITMGKKAKHNVKRYLPETIMAQWDSLFKEIAQ